VTNVADLVSMDRSALAVLWARLFGTCVPPNMSQGLQRRFLAHLLQIREHGDLPAPVAARLDRIATCNEREVAPVLRPGARLLRQWNGTTHVVDVVRDGYLWNGTCHRSLSVIARTITGTRWSGPRFFGLVEEVRSVKLAGTRRTR